MVAQLVLQVADVRLCSFKFFTKVLSRPINRISLACLGKLIGRLLALNVNNLLFKENGLFLDGLAFL